MSLELHKDRQEADELIDRADDEAGREQMFWDRVDRFVDFGASPGEAAAQALREERAA